MKCIYCDYREEAVIYQDDFIVAIAAENALVPGQVTIFPKEHFTIMELVPEDVVQHCSILANKLGMAVFESLGCQGTNVLIKNGVSAGQKIPHFALQVIPRSEHDGLQLQWQPKQLMEDEVDEVYSILKEGLEQKESKSIESKPEEKVKTEIVAEKGKPNYLLKSIRRRA